MDRRSSSFDQGTTPIRRSIDVFADDFEVDDFDGVADGFRPRDDREDEEEQEEENIGQQRDFHLRSTSAQYVPDAISHDTPALQPRNSTRKSRSYRNPFASPEDGQEEEEPMLSFEPSYGVHRSVSSASSVVFARTNTPGMTSGPSHPYGMYPQGTLARTASVATTSTIRAHAGPSTDFQRGPQHPYALYPQGVEEDDDEAHTPQNSVPVGFPGLGRGYNRQLGPDGEEQDIIGEDGHAEQLPPYSRYPEDGPEKVPLLGVPVAPTPSHSRAPVAGTDPGMPLMHQNLLPSPSPEPGPSAQPQSMSDESTLIQQVSRQSASQSITVNGSIRSYKSWSEKSWKEKRKTRFCGIPLWYYILAAGVITFVATVLGGVIGGYVMGAEKHSKMTYSEAVSQLYDASAIATPTQSPPPTGTYALSMSTAQGAQSACLANSAQQPAWSCDLVGAPGIAINVEWDPTANALGASLFYASDSAQISYGNQMSWIDTGYAPFRTVQDNDSPDAGPAYYFHTTYNKLVVLPESAFTAPSDTASSNNKDKRQTFHLDTSWIVQKSVTQPGDKPWFCVWNNTFLEAFIYIEDAPNPTFTRSASVTASATTTSMTSSSSTPWTWDSSWTAVSSYGHIDESPRTYSGGNAQSHSWATDTATTSDTDDGYHKPQSTQNQERQNYDDLWQNLALYPYIIKIEERRLAGNSISPYCQQYQILDNGGFNPVTVPGPNNTTVMVVVGLNETDPSYAAYQSAGTAGTRKMMNKRTVEGECHCQWMSGQ